MTVQRYDIGQGQLALLGTFVRLCVLFYTFVALLSGIAQVIQDGTDLPGGEILAVTVVAGGFQLLSEPRIAVDPAHQMAGCRAWVAVGEVEHGELLLAVTTDFH